MAAMLAMCWVVRGVRCACGGMVDFVAYECRWVGGEEGCAAGVDGRAWG